jgi:hypothetical protein
VTDIQEIHKDKYEIYSFVFRTSERGVTRFIKELCSGIIRLGLAHGVRTFCTSREIRSQVSNENNG